MPVVINEFEIVAEPLPPPPSAAPADADAPTAPPWTARDLMEMLDRLHDRAARVRAD